MSEPAETFHSAVAEYEGDDGWVVGYSLGHRTEREAERQAVSQCNRESAGSCRTLDTFIGPGCVAVARGDNDGGGIAAYFGDDNVRDAPGDALAECRRRGGTNCRVTKGECITRADVDSGNYREITQSAVLREQIGPELIGRWEGDYNFTFADGSPGYTSITLEITDKESERSYSGIMESESSRFGCGARQRMQITRSASDNINMRGTVLSTTCSSVWHPDSYRLRLNGDEMTGTKTDTKGQSGNNVTLIKVD